MGILGIGIPVPILNINVLCSLYLLIYIPAWYYDTMYGVLKCMAYTHEQMTGQLVVSLTVVANGLPISLHVHFDYKN